MVTTIAASTSTIGGMLLRAAVAVVHITATPGCHGLDAGKRMLAGPTQHSHDNTPCRATTNDPHRFPACSLWKTSSIWLI
jgi:hypothetical protein